MNDIIMETFSYEFVWQMRGLTTAIICLAMCVKFGCDKIAAAIKEKNKLC